MNYFESVLYFLQGTMEEPKPFGWFHILCILLTGLSIFVLYQKKDNYSEAQLKKVLGIYGIVAFVLEVMKQIVWSFNYDITSNLVTWDYQWYAAPFQLCTTPIYVSLICLFLKKSKLRDSLLSYLSFVTILGSIATIIMPDSCFTSTTLVNIHTMWLHCGSLVVSIYLIFTIVVSLDFKSLKNGLIVFLAFICLAELLNVSIYNLGLLQGETFNMFYISPYFISELPIFDMVQKSLPFVIYLLFYIIVLSLGSLLVFGIFKFIEKLKSCRNQ